MRILRSNPGVWTFLFLSVFSAVLLWRKPPLDLWKSSYYAFSVFVSFVFWWWLGEIALRFHGLRRFLAPLVGVLLTLIVVASLYIYQEFSTFINYTMIGVVIDEPRFIWGYFQSYVLKNPLTILMFLFVVTVFAWPWWALPRRYAAAWIFRQSRWHLILLLAVGLTFPYLSKKTAFFGSRHVVTMDMAWVSAVRDTFAQLKYVKAKKLRPSEKLALAATQAPSPYNVVLLINESWGKQSLSFFDGKKATTPFLSSWMEKERDQFFVFPRAYTQSGATDLSVPSILTGVGPHEDNDHLLKMPFVWNWARAAGLSSFLVSSHTYRWGGFTLFFFNPDNVAPNHFFVAENINSPFFNDLGVDDLETAAYFEKSLDMLPQGKPFLGVFQSNALHYPFQKTSPHLAAAPQVGSPYENALVVLDAAFQKVVESVRAKGQLEYTIFIFTSDHGQPEESLHGLPRTHNHYEEVLNIPLLIRLPKRLLNERPEVAAALRENARENVGNIDIVPTVADLLRADRSPENRPILEMLQGRSLLKPIPSERVLVAVNTNDYRKWDREGFGIVWRDQRFVFLEKDRPRLFNVAHDPLQSRDLWETGKEEQRIFLGVIQSNRHLNRVFKLYGDK